MNMKPNTTCRYPAVLAIALALLLAVGGAQAQISTSVQSASGSPRFPWRAGSLAVASFDGVTIGAALPGVYICGIAFLLPSGQQWVSTGAGPVALVAADLDSDGDVDVAVAEQDGGSVSILTNDGLAGFTRTDAYATGDLSGPLYPTSIVAVDIDQDGRLDLVVANRGAENVVVFHNTGDGFLLTQTVAVTNEPNSLAVADVDNDGWADIAVACATDDMVKILRNISGIFSLGGSFPGGAYPVAVAAADLDNDGDTDLAAANRESPQVTVLLNDGAGQFASTTVTLSEPNARFQTPIDLQLVDIDSDGMVDIRCAGMTVLNRGNGNFEVTDSYTLSGAAYARGSLPGDPTTYLGVAYAPSASSNIVSVGPPSFQAGLIHVATSGDDGNDGLSWSTAKRTVQAGVNAAQPGRQVWVAVGTYVENISLKPGVALYGGFAGLETRLYQRNWRANETILDGNQIGAVVVAPSDTPPNLTYGTRIDGFTIRNGVGYYPGGGIRCYASSLTIANNTITGNSGDGGAIYSVTDSSPIIIGNTIAGNDAQYGGAVKCYAGAVICNNSVTDNNGSGIECTSPTIVNNVIARNATNGIRCFASSSSTSSPQIIGNTITANGGSGIFCEFSGSTSAATPAIIGNMIANNITPSSGGGGIYYCGSSTAVGAGTIANNIITGNVLTGSNSTTRNGGGVYCLYASPAISGNTVTGNNADRGGGIWCERSSPTITGNVIAGNNASSYGGGIACYANSSSLIANNTIVTNYGGAIFSTGGTLTITNTIVARNSSGITAGSTTVLRSNCVYGNPEGNYFGVTDPTGTNGNVSVDPKMAQTPYANAHIQPDSPCVDAGDDSVIKSDWVDMDGQPRIQGAHADIGADESDGTAWPAMPVVIVRVSHGGNNANAGSSWLLAKRTVQAGVDAAAPSGGQVWVMAGTYVENIILPVEVAMYGGFAGSETDLTQRDWAVNETILDGNRLGSVIRCRTGTTQSTRIDGFTIRNGIGDLSLDLGNSFGGGINCYSYSSPTIANNTIMSNGAYYGGGISCYGHSSPTIANNTIIGNDADSGAGICCYSYSSPMIMNNSIAGNKGMGPFSAGIFCRDYASPTIASNTIASNARGGIRCYSYSSQMTSFPMIASSTIVGNGGGGIFSVTASTTITNTIVAFNVGGISVASGTPSLRHNCVYGNVSGGTVRNYFNVTDPTGTNGNISIDPLFVRPTSIGPDGFWGSPDDDWGDLRLLPFSPCVDAGSNADVPTDMADLDGDGDTAEPLPLDRAGAARFLDDPQTANTGSGTSPIVDMGAYERGRPISDVDGDWLTDVVDLLYMVDGFGKSQGDDGFDPRCDFNSDGAVDIFDLLDLVHNFGK
jgi:hypothetical protein